MRGVKDKAGAARGRQYATAVWARWLAGTSGMTATMEVERCNGRQFIFRSDVGRSSSYLHRRRRCRRHCSPQLTGLITNESKNDVVYRRNGTDAEAVYVSDREREKERDAAAAAVA